MSAINTYADTFKQVDAILVETAKQAISLRQPFAASTLAENRTRYSAYL